MRVVTAREQYEALAYWRKTADPTMTLERPTAPEAPPPTQPPTMTSIPRSQFDAILAPKGVTYDQHLDNLESHFNGATQEQQKRGRVWYRAGGDTLRDIGKKFGISTNRAIAMAAALSARTDWANNLHFAAHMAGRYRPGENEDEWQRAVIHPSALAKYMENRYDIHPANKPEAGKWAKVNPNHFTLRELRALHKGGYMPRTKADFEQLAAAHGGDHYQYTPPLTRNGEVVMDEEGKPVRPGRWENKPLAGFEDLQTREGRDAWINNAQMPGRGGNPTERAPYEDAIDAHIRSVKDSTSEYGFRPNTHYTGAGVPTLGKSITKAKLLRQVPEEDFEKHLGGLKYKAFFSNLGNSLRFLKASRPEDQGYYDHGGRHWTEHDPELHRSTIDTQHMRAASVQHGDIGSAKGYAEGSEIDPAQYEVYQQGLIDLTHRINSKLPSHKQLLPHQIQAIIWGKFKDDLDARENARKGVGQTFWSPEMEGIAEMGGRYARRLLAMTFEGDPEWHIDPALLEHPHSDPYYTDSDDWWANVLDSWHRRHQHELSDEEPRPEHFGAVQAALDTISFIDTLVSPPQEDHQLWL